MFLKEIGLETEGINGEGEDYMTASDTVERSDCLYHLFL